MTMQKKVKQRRKMYVIKLKDLFVLIIIVLIF